MLEEETIALHLQSSSSAKFSQQSVRINQTTPNCPGLCTWWDRNCTVWLRASSDNCSRHVVAGFVWHFTCTCTCVCAYTCTLHLCYMDQWIMAMRAIGCFVAVSSNWQSNRSFLADNWRQTANTVHRRQIAPRWIGNSWIALLRSVWIGEGVGDRRLCYSLHFVTVWTFICSVWIGEGNRRLCYSLRARLASAITRPVGLYKA